MDDSRKFVQEWQISINGEEITRVRPGETAVIGRKPLRAIPEEKGIRRVDITDVTKSMSKRHVLLKTDFDGNASIEDLGSTNGTFIQQDNGALLRIPFNTPFSFPRMIERVQLGEVPVDFIKVKSEISAASPAGQNSDDLFKEVDDDPASIVPQRKMSVDEIMDLRAGEPTSMFAADNVRSAVQEKNDLAAAAAAAPEFAPVAAEEQANIFESELATRPVGVGSVNPTVSQMSVPKMTVPEVNAPEMSTAATASAEVNDSEVSVQALQEYAAAETAAETAVGESVPAESVSAGSVSAGSVQSESLPDAGFSFENAEPETVSAENTVSAQSAADAENTGDDGVSVENAAIENAAAAKTSEANAAAVSGAESVSQQAAKQTEEQSSEQEAGQQNAALNDAGASLFDTEWDGTVINDAVNAASNIAAASNTASESALFESEQSSQSVLNMQSVQNVHAQNESAQIDESVLFPTFTDPAFDQQPAQQQSAEHQAQSSSEQKQSEQTQSESVQSETARQSQSEEYAKKDTSLFSSGEWPVFPDETAGDGYTNDVLEHKPVYEAGSVFDRLQRNEYGKTASVVEEGGYTSDKARTSSDYSEQFAMAQLPSLLPFLAMNPSLYDDLYAWLQAQGNADIDKALTDNAGFRRWAANQGK